MPFLLSTATPVSYLCAVSLPAMSSTAVSVEAPAYVKMMLHAAKYPWAAVNGFLLGEGGSAAGQVRCSPVDASLTVVREA